MTVFLDTYGLIAWINTRDAGHQRVKSLTADHHFEQAGFQAIFK